MGLKLEKSSNPISKTKLRTELEQHYHLVAFEDISKISDGPALAYRLLYSLYQTHYNDNERIVFYTNQDPPDTLINFLQKAIDLVDISSFFVCVYTNVVDADPLLTGYQNDILCPLPWLHTEVRNNGDYAPCCEFSNAQRSLSLTNASFEDYRYGTELHEIRTTMLDNKWHDGCINCKRIEDTNGVSNRKLALENFHKVFYQQEITEQPHKLQSLDIKPGNLCNLKCRICVPFNSSKIATEEILRLQNVDPTQIVPLRFELNGCDWPKNPQYWQKVLDATSDLIEIDVFGGEPWLHDYHGELLDFLIKHKTSKKITLHYNTNGTIYPGNFVYKWNYFKLVDIAFSVDDIGDRFEYQRQGADWNGVLNNIKLLLELPDSNLRFSFYVTISVLNVFYLPQLVRTIEEFGIPIHYNILHKPDTLSIYQLSTEARRAILANYAKFSFDEENIVNILQIPESGDHDSICNEIKSKDVLRGQNFAQAHPEMAKILGMI